MKPNRINSFQNGVRYLNLHILHSETPSFSIGVFSSFLVFAAILISTYLFAELQIKQSYLNEYESLSVTRSKIEGSLNSRMLLANGLVSYIKTHPAFQREDLDQFCKNLVSNDKLIKSMSVIKNNTIIFEFPYSQSKTAIGADLIVPPQQENDFLTVKKTGKPLVTTMINLVEGGKGIVYRLPIMFDQTIDGKQKQNYWGQVSIVLEGEKLLSQVDPNNINSKKKIAVVGYYDSGNRQNMIYGDLNTLENSTIQLNISLPYCDWLLAERLPMVNPFLQTHILLILLVGFVFSIIVGLFINNLIHMKNQLKKLAYQDVLTKIPNRLSINDHFDTFTNKAKHTGSLLGILALDINKFKQINDSYGHNVGDLLLVKFAERINSVLRPTDVFIRTGGDEFVIFCPFARTRGDIEKVVQRIRRLEEMPYLLEGVELHVTTSIGYSIYPEDGDKLNPLLDLADKAMYMNKNCENPSSQT